MQQFGLKCEYRWEEYCVMLPSNIIMARCRSAAAAVTSSSLKMKASTSAEMTHPPYLRKVPGFVDEKFCLVKAPFFCFRIQHDRQPFQTNMCSNWRKNLGFDWRTTAIHFQCFDRRAQRQCRLRTDSLDRYSVLTYIYKLILENNQMCTGVFKVNHRRRNGR